MEKQWTLPNIDEQLVIELHENLEIHPAICQLLVQRGIRSVAAARRFFQPQPDQLHDPFLMKNMDKAVSRLQQAIDNNEHILIYGDYDVDGTVAVSLLFSFLEKYHSRLYYYIPDRYKEGYGLSLAGVDYARQNGVGLLITLDCGIKATQQIARANAYGIDVIVCDHHLPEANLPEALAILNPKQTDCSYPYKELCGAGVAFKFAQAFAQKNNLPASETNALLDLVVIATACDIVPLTGENRLLAYFGLQQLQQSTRAGVNALIDLSKRPQPLTISDVVFGLGPMINAAGRLADARESVKLLLATDKFVAADQARVLSHHNERRKELDKTMVEEASSSFEHSPDWQNRKSIVLYQADWHKGVVGIVAARMTENYHRPSIILTESEGKIVGSARSIPGFDIHAAIEHCADLLLNFGGHQHAAGLTLAPENLEAFQQRFEAEVAATLAPEFLLPEIKISAELKFSAITPRLWKDLKKMAPFGPGNRNPVFVSRRLEDTGDSRLLKDNHLRLMMKQNASEVFSGIAFGQGAIFQQIKENPFDLCYTLQENHWNGTSTIQLVVKDIKV